MGTILLNTIIFTFWSFIILFLTFITWTFIGAGALRLSENKHRKWDLKNYVLYISVYTDTPIPEENIPEEPLIRFTNDDFSIARYYQKEGKLLSRIHILHYKLNAFPTKFILLIPNTYRRYMHYANENFKAIEEKFI